MTIINGIALVGRNRVGKSTVAQLLKLGLTQRNQDWVHLSFATPLKVTFAKAYDILSNWQLDPKQKEELRPLLIQFSKDYKKIHGEDVWLKKFISELPVRKNIIIDDLSFQHELEWLQANNFLVVGLVSYSDKSPYNDAIDEQRDKLARSLPHHLIVDVDMLKTPAKYPRNYMGITTKIIKMYENYNRS